jgi:hypothetical protein
MASPFRKVAVRSEACEDLGNALDAIRKRSRSQMSGDTNELHAKRQRASQSTASNAQTTQLHTHTAVEETFQQDTEELLTAEQQPFNITGSGLPIDWALKTCITVSCKVRGFAWASSLTLPSSSSHLAPNRASETLDRFISRTTNRASCACSSDPNSTHTSTANDNDNDNTDATPQCALTQQEIEDERLAIGTLQYFVHPANREAATRSKVQQVNSTAIELAYVIVGFDR